MPRTIRWAIIGAGNIANRFAAAVEAEPTSELQALYGRDAKRLQAFAATHPAKSLYTDVDELLADADIDAVYVSLPHGLHKEVCVKALEAGLPVLCEKPAALTAVEAARIVDVARDRGVLFMEAQKARFQPVSARVRDILASGVLGPVGSIEATFMRKLSPKTTRYIYDPVQGGVALDMGIYVASWLDEYAQGAIRVDEAHHRYHGPVDMADMARLTIGDVACDVRVIGDEDGPATVTIRCANGSVEVEPLHRPTRAVVRQDGMEDAVWDMAYDPNDFAGELMHFQELVRQERTESDVMPLADTVRCARIIDAIKSGYDRYSLAEELATHVGEDDVLLSEPMSAHTTFKIGGPADVFVNPASKRQVEEVLRVVREAGVDHFVLGLGSDLLVSDSGYHGVIVNCSAQLNDVRPEGDRLVCQAGASLAEVSEMAATLGLSGLEFACGIPGTVGGAVFMNAGAYDGCISDVLESATVVMPDGTVKTLANAELDFGYRASRVRAEGLVVLEATFDLKPKDPGQIRSVMDDLTRRRNEKQPLDLPSAGSTFKRPEGHFVGKLLTDAGLKGERIGGAEVSTKHAGFVVNADHATAMDVARLIAQIQGVIKEKDGVELEPEVRFLGRF